MANTPFPFKLPKSRTPAEVDGIEANATHLVYVQAPGGTALDMDIFAAAGVYSSFSGCHLRTGLREHGWYVVGAQDAQKMMDRIVQLKTWLEDQFGVKYDITVKVSKI